MLRYWWFFVVVPLGFIFAGAYKRLLYLLNPEEPVPHPWGQALASLLTMIATTAIFALFLPLPRFGGKKDATKGKAPESDRLHKDEKDQ